MRRTISEAFLAGIFIGIAGLMYLRVGGVPGAILFSLGLIGVVHYKLPLFTGVSGFLRWGKGEGIWLLQVLLGNVGGVGLVAVLGIGALGISDLAIPLGDLRVEKGWWQCFGLGVGCGLLMTTAVSGLKPWVSREDRTWIPLLFCVPGFILCGFFHSIADGFYLLACGWEWWKENWAEALGSWSAVVLGNFTGCNLPNALIYETNKPKP